MKELLIQYAKYNVWANKLLIAALLKLDDEKLDTDLVSSFSSLRKTVYHLWSAEYVWLQRLQLAEHPKWMADDFSGSFEEACNEWQSVSGELAAFIEKQYDDRAFQHVLQYYDLKKVSHKSPVYEVLLHIFNHATYHRGQLVTMLRQVGITTIPRTDFIAFARKK